MGSGPAPPAQNWAPQKRFRVGSGARGEYPNKTFPYPRDDFDDLHNSFGGIKKKYEKCLAFFLLLTIYSQFFSIIYIKKFNEFR